MKKYWPLLRTLIYLTIGIFNTILIRPEEVGTWKNYLGYLFIALVVFDIGSYVFKKLKR